MNGNVGSGLEGTGLQRVGTVVNGPRRFQFHTFLNPLYWR
ncbi:MAG: hypothetical protein RLZZ444_1208 [Pseudomonadota bacterium]